MRQERNQSYDQKKGSADCDVTGSKKGMPGGEIGRSLGGTSNASRSAGSGSDYGGSEGNSRERKSARHGSDSNES